MTSSINNSNNIPDPLTTWNGTDINSSNLGYIEDEAAFAGMADGISGDDSDDDDGLSSGSPSTSDTYQIGINLNSANEYNPSNNSDFYNIGVTDTTPDTPLAQAALTQQRETAWNNARRSANQIKI